MAKPKVNWPKDYPPSKSLLERAILSWVKARTGFDDVENLDRLTQESLTVLAMAMGYKASAQFAGMLRERQQRNEANATANRQRYLTLAAERAVAENMPDADLISTLKTRLPPTG